jgi:hypothetical protein
MGPSRGAPHARGTGPATTEEAGRKRKALMATLQILNQVRDFDAWKSAFDSYERFRAENGVRRYRVLRSVAEPERVVIHLDFDTDEEAVDYLPRLARILATPRSRQELAGHDRPELMTLVTDQTLTG